MVTSRWFFEFVRDWARSAILAARFKSTGKLPYAGWDAKVKTEFQTLKTGLSHVASGYTTWEVLETQAVIEGLWGAMPTPSADKVVFAARKFYNAHTKYRHIFDHMVEQFGVEPAVSLGPKLCAIALQYDEPGGVMSDLLRDLEKARGGIDILAKMSATEIVKSRRMDPHTVSRSCRELGAAPRDPGDIVMTVLSRYFDLYEALGQKERLSAMMHPGRLGGYAPAGKPIFLPMYGLFGDGRCIDPQRSKRNMTDFAAWVSIGLQVVDGIAWLSE
jgi:hypothetical protein